MKVIIKERKEATEVSGVERGIHSNGRSISARFGNRGFTDWLLLTARGLLLR